MAKVTKLAQPPYQFAMTDRSGMLSDAWSKWILDLYARVGGPTAIANADASSALSSPIINQLATIAAKTLYTSPSGQTTLFDSFTVKNNDSVAQSISVYAVPIGQSPDSSNLIISAQSIAAGQTASLTSMMSVVLSSGSSIVTVASTDGVLLVQASGRQVS